MCQHTSPLNKNSAFTLTSKVFVIPFQDKFILYFPFKKTAFIGDAHMVNLLYDLKHCTKKRYFPREKKLIRFLKKLGLVNGNPDIYPQTKIQRNFLPITTTLFLTTGCNLCCIYCYAASGDNKLENLPLHIAKRAIDYICQNALESGQHYIEVGYHGGGEPTSNWDVLTNSYQYAKSIASSHSLNLRASLATNGYLTTKKLEWITKNLDGVSLSVDGLPEVHNLQRPGPKGRGTFTEVFKSIQFFDKMNFKYGIRLTVTQESVSKLTDSILFLCQETNPVRIQVEPVYNIGRGKIFPFPEAKTFIEQFRQADKIASQRGIELYYSAARIDTITNYFCKACGESFCVSTAGQVTACYEAFSRSVPMADKFFFGSFYKKSGKFRIDSKKLSALYLETVENIDYCKDCFCKWHCAGDCPYKRTLVQGDGDFRGTQRCLVTRELTRDQILKKIIASGGTVWSESS